MDILSENNLLDLRLTEESKSSLATIAQWSNMNAIAGFVSLAVTIITTIKGIMIVNTNDTSSGAVAAGGGIFTLLIIAGISLLLNITLYIAAKNIKNGLESGEQGIFNFGLAKFKTYFLILGVLMIILLAIVAIVVLFALVIGASHS